MCCLIQGGTEERENQEAAADRSGQPGGDGQEETEVGDHLENPEEVTLLLMQEEEEGRGAED